MTTKMIYLTTFTIITLILAVVNADGQVSTQKITKLVLYSKCSAGPWKADSTERAPTSYLTGMTLMYLKAYCEVKNNISAASIDMSKPNSGRPSDLFGYYEDDLKRNNVPLGSALERLKAAFSIAIAVGMNESSGNPTVGAYIKNNPVQAEGGLFQLSYDSLSPHASSPWLLKLYRAYEKLPMSCLKETFMKGLLDKHEEPIGTGAPRMFQENMKKCPALSVEYGVVELRTSATYYGTVIGTNPHGRSNKALFVPACYKMLTSAESLANCAK